MKRPRARKSAAAFLIIAAAAIFAPLIAPASPYEICGAPFARPVWWRAGSLSKTRVFNIASDRFSFDRDRDAPAIFSVSGLITAAPEKTVNVVWQTPKESYVLARLSGSESYWLNIDGRDILLKRALGLPLIGKSSDYLFPARGRYSISAEGASSVSLKISMLGARQGLLGTDQRGRDVFSRLLYGARASFVIGISATIAASLLGMAFGLAAGFFGGVCDALIMRLVDILLSIPTLPILMVLAGTWGKGLWQIVVILSVFSWMGTARSVRALVLSVRESAWVEALRALGAKKTYILRRHLIAETAPILLANVALGVPGAILSEAGLAFLGLSDPRLVSWGRMLHEAHAFGAFTEGAWWTLLPPGAAIAVVCLIFMDFGKYLEEKIDPRLAKK